jgi:hypothetical protein
MPRIKGTLASPQGASGRIRLEDPSLLTQHMQKGDPRIKTVALSLQDFRYQRLRLAVDLSNEETATAQILLHGRSEQNRKLPPVRLNVNVEADTEDIVYLGRLFRHINRLSSSAR